MSVRLTFIGLLLAVSEALAGAPRVGTLLPPAAAKTEEATLRSALRDLGYVEGRSIILEVPTLSGADSDVKLNAARFVEQRVDLILAFGTPATRAAVEATNRIPIVFIAGDPVASGFADSLAKPGSNATGLSVLTPELTAKRFELLRQLLPRANLFGLLYNPANPLSGRYLEEARAAAASLSLKLEPYPARNLAEMQQALRAMQGAAPDGLVVAAGLTYLSDPAWLTQAVAKARIPAVYPIREYHDSAALMSYGYSVKYLMRRAATFIDRILKGSKPAEIPVEELNTFQLVIDLRVARELKVEVPSELLLRADEVLR